jgi:hypothetical protein
MPTQPVIPGRQQATPAPAPGAQQDQQQTHRAHERGARAAR